MKTVTSFLSVISILFSLSSCSSFIFVQKTYDPEIIPENKAASIVFVNLFDYTAPIYVKEKNMISYHAGVWKLTEGLLSSSAGDKTYKFFTGDSLKKGTEAGQLTALLPIDSVIAICARNKANLLLALDSMNIYFDWETAVDDNSDGSKSKTKNFYLFTRFYMSLYSTTGDLINRSKVENSLLYKSRPTLSGLITIQPSISKASRAVESLAFQAGQDYAGKFYPKTVQESRKIYAGKAFKESNLFIKLRNYDKATELLDQLVKSPNPNIAMKARHNLLVVKEAAALER
jgi:hypothetical protein